MKILYSRFCTALLIAFLLLMPACNSRLWNLFSNEKKVAAILKELELLETEAERIEDADAVKRLQRTYGYYFDQGMWNEAADLFAPDATLEIGLDGVYEGQERIRQYLIAFGRGHEGLKHGQLNDHIIIQPVVHVAKDGRSAKARWRALIMTGQLGKNAFWGEGIFENEYVKQNDNWKISKLHWYQTFIVPYAGGWAMNKDNTGGIHVSKRLPPDHPPTERYEVWPGAYMPPFHYKNSAGASFDISTNSDPAVAALAHRIGLLHDIDEIENLVSMYGYYLDKRQWDLFVGLFAENSTMEIAQRGIYQGKKSIRRAMELFGTQNIDRNYLHNHIQLQPVIHVAPDGRHAQVRSRALSMLGLYKKIGVWGDSVYENELIKENGGWKFKKDHTYTTFFAPYDKGWALDPRPAPKISKNIPPDLPPSEVYESFPEIYIPPFHYKNRATGTTNTSKIENIASQMPPKVRESYLQLSRKVAKLEDENAIENLQRIYGYYYDKQLWKDAAGLFASDATLEIGGSGVFAGKARVLDYLTRLAPNGLTRGRISNCLQLQPVIHVAPDGNTARGRWRFIAESGEYKKAAAWGGGTYENEYVKEEGIWKIKSLHQYSRVYTPYADGWGKTAIPNSRPDRNFAPDHPPTVQYDSYPSTFTAPFHYRHSVTAK
jgi:hypothetical protein